MLLYSTCLFRPHSVYLVKKCARHFLYFLCIYLITVVVSFFLVSKFLFRTDISVKSLSVSQSLISLSLSPLSPPLSHPPSLSLSVSFRLLTYKDMDKCARVLTHKRYRVNGFKLAEKYFRLFLLLLSYMDYIFACSLFQYLTNVFLTVQNFIFLCICIPKIV